MLFWSRKQVDNDSARGRLFQQALKGETLPEVEDIYQSAVQRITDIASRMRSQLQEIGRPIHENSPANGENGNSLNGALSELLVAIERFCREEHMQTLTKTETHAHIQQLQYLTKIWENIGAELLPIEGILRKTKERITQLQRKLDDAQSKLLRANAQLIQLSEAPTNVYRPPVREGKLQKQRAETQKRIDEALGEMDHYGKKLRHVDIEQFPPNGTSKNEHVSVSARMVSIRERLLSLDPSLATIAPPHEAFSDLHESTRNKEETERKATEQQAKAERSKKICSLLDSASESIVACYQMAIEDAAQETESHRKRQMEMSPQQVSQLINRNYHSRIAHSQRELAVVRGQKIAAALEEATDCFEDTVIALESQIQFYRQHRKKLTGDNRNSVRSMASLDGKIQAMDPEKTRKPTRLLRRGTNMGMHVLENSVKAEELRLRIEDYENMKFYLHLFHPLKSLLHMWKKYKGQKGRE